MTREYFFAAIKEGDLNACNQILDVNPLLLHQTDCNGESPLLLAIREQHLQIVKCLLKKAPELINSQHSLSKLTPLQLAVRLADEKTVACLIEAGAKPFQIGEFGNSALHEAAQFNRVSFVSLLLNSQVGNLDIKGHQDRTPLHLAAKEGNFEVAKLLLAAKACPEIPDKQLGMPIHYAVSRQHKSMVKVLIAYGADLNQRNVTGETPLQMALRSKNPDWMVKLLVRYGANVNLPTSLTKISSVVTLQDKSQKELLEHALQMAKNWQNKKLEKSLIALKSGEESVGLYGDWLSPKQTDRFMNQLIRAYHIQQVTLGRNIDRLSNEQKTLLNQHLEFTQQLAKAKQAAQNEDVTQLLALTEPHTILYEYAGYNALHVLAEFGLDGVLSAVLAADVSFVRDKRGRYPADIAHSQRHSTFAARLSYLAQLQQFKGLLQCQNSHNNTLHYEVARLHLQKQLETLSIQDTFSMLKDNLGSSLKSLSLNTLMQHAKAIWTMYQQLKRATQLVTKEPLLLSGSQENISRKGKATLTKIPKQKKPFILIEGIISQIEDHIKACQSLPELKKLVLPLQCLRDYYKQFLETAETLLEADLSTWQQEPTLMLSRLGARLLLEEPEQLLMGDVKGRPNTFGTHVVIAHEGIHFKLSPHAPGIEFAVDALNNLVAGQGSTPTELIKIERPTVGSKVYLASKTVEGTELLYLLEHQPELIGRIDFFNFSALVVQSLLTMPQDGKPDNYRVRVHSDSKHQLKHITLVSIDNDMAFAEPFAVYKSAHLSGKHFINLRNVLYFFPQMEQVIHPELRLRLLQQTPERLLTAWLRLLHEKNQEYDGLLEQGYFTHKEYTGDNQQTLGLQLPIKFAPNQLMQLYQKLKMMLAIIEKSESITLNSLFKHIYPELYLSYQDILNEAEQKLLTHQKALHKGELILKACSILYTLGKTTVEERLQKHLSEESVHKALTPFTEEGFDFEFKRQISLEQAVENWLAKIAFTDCSLQQQASFRVALTSLSFLKHLTLTGITINTPETLREWVIGLPQLKQLTLKAVTLSALPVQILSACRPFLQLSIHDDCLGSQAETLLSDICSLHRHITFIIENFCYNLAQSPGQLLCQVMRNRHYPEWFVRTLFKHPELNLTEEFGGGDTLLHIAVQERQSKMVEALLEQGGAVNTQNAGGYSLLHVAVKLNDIKLVNLLLQWDINPFLTKRDGKTPREACIGYGYDVLAKHLQAYEEHSSYTPDESPENSSLSSSSNEPCSKTLRPFELIAKPMSHTPSARYHLNINENSPTLSRIAKTKMNKSFGDRLFTFK